MPDSVLEALFSKRTRYTESLNFRAHVPVIETNKLLKTYRKWCLVVMNCPGENQGRVTG